MSPLYEVIDVPARLGLLADTHWQVVPDTGIVGQLLRGLDGCDAILHAGDVTTMAVLRRLEGIGDVLGVAGNNDDIQVVTALPAERHLSVGRWRLGLLHGHGGPGPAREVAYRQMKGSADCVVYGHSHLPDCSRVDGMLMINPGSPSQRRRAPARTYAIMTIDDELSVTHFELT